MKKIHQRLLNLISNSNSQGWIDEFNIEYLWSYCDGTQISSKANYFNDVNLWLETYDELDIKIIKNFKNISFSNAEIVPILMQFGNFLEFTYQLEFMQHTVLYKYIQFGEGVEVACTIDIPSNLDLILFSDWLDSAIKNDWQVSRLT
jgi:hypothetical protein